MKKMLSTLAALSIAAVPVTAQEMNHEGGEMSHTDPVTSIWKLQDQFMGWVITAAEQGTADDYAFRPVEGVRSMGELLGHIANANYTFCSTMKGEASPNKVDHEEVSRSEIIAGLKAGQAYCAEAAEVAAAQHHDARSLFGSDGDVTWVTAWNIAHNAEHYGNLVTYIRMQGKVPPSSQ